jgi:hypothetical protein
MPDLAALNAESLLRVPLDQPERLFPADPDRARAEYRRLAARWHPDRNPDAQAAAVFQRVTALYRLAAERLRGGGWCSLEPLLLRGAAGVTRRFAFHRRRSFELGTLYLAEHSLAFVVAPEHIDLLDHALGRIVKLPFGSPAMRNEMARALPSVEGRFDSRDGPCVVLCKPRELVLLADLVDHLGGRLPVRHAAWVVSSLCNIACYLEHAGIAHNAIGLDTYFVSPDGHWGALLGGWWYAMAVGAALAAVPVRTNDLLCRRTADVALDRALIRLTARELLGDADGYGLAVDAAVPPPLADWLCLGPGESAIDDYRHWQNVLRASFGARRFVELGVTASDIYP